MLEKLSQVQTYDLDLDALEDKKKLTPQELIDIERRKEELEANLAGVQQAYHGLRRQVDANELELSSLSDRRKAAADAARAAMNPKEVSQYQNQELQFAARLEELETDTLPLIERMDELEAEMTGLQEELKALEPEYQRMLEAERQRIAEIEEESAVIAGNRDALAREIDAGLLRQYEQVRRSRRGLGLVPIIGNRRCGGCNVQLPLYVMQKASRAQGVTRCPSCGRILWPQSGSS